MEIIVLAPSAKDGWQWQCAVENLGPQWRCTPVLRAEQVLHRLHQSVDVLLLLPCRESDALLAAVEARPPLAPPYLLGNHAPDGPLLSPEELPDWLHAHRSSLCLPALHGAHLPVATEIASALLRTMEVPPRLRAWAFLPEMCALTVVHPPLLQDLKHGLYPLIGQRCGMTAAGVERSLRLCVESTWTHGRLGALERFFGASVDPERGKPTNREFLCRVQERLTISLRRLV